MTGAPILQQAISGVRLAVEIAWGADLTDLTGASWTWSDITSDVLMGTDAAGAGNITIRIGRPDESSQTQASQFTCVLDNRTSNYSQGGQSANWPNVVRNTPVRVRVSTNSGSTWTVKYQGGAVSWQPSWDEAGRFATVVLTASDALRQLNQGTLAVKSAMRLAMENDPNTVAYWPVEDGASATSAKIVIPSSGGSNGAWDTSLNATIGTFASYNGFWCSYPVATLATAASMHFVVPSYTPTNQTQINFLLGPTKDTANTVAPTTNTTDVMSAVSTGTGNEFQIYYLKTNANNPNSGVLRFYSGATLESSAIYNSDFQSQLCYLQLTQSGADINYVLGTKAQGQGLATMSGTITGKTIGTFTDIWMDSHPNSYGGPYTFGHVSLQTVCGNMLTAAPGVAVSAYLTEAPSARITRLCNNANIPVTVLTSTTAETSTNPADVMGPQYVDNLTNLIREAEATGLGVLYGGLNQGLTYVTRLLRESQQPLLTLDASAGDLAVQFAPVDDDQLTVNDVTASRRNGASFTSQAITGPLGIDSIGDYQGSLTVNPSDDSNLDKYAEWGVHLGTQQGYRYPTISFALDRIPSKIASWLTMIPTSRFDVTNITSLRSQMPSGTIRNVLEGWTETIDAFSWHVTANATTWNAWNVGTMAASTGTTVDTVMRRDTDGSAVNTATSVGATSVSVKLTAAGKPLWTTASDDCPMLVSMGGVPVTVTAISGASSPQTFTVASPGVPIALIVNDPVQLWNPPVLGM